MFEAFLKLQQMLNPEFHFILHYYEFLTFIRRDKIKDNKNCVDVKGSSPLNIPASMHACISCLNSNEICLLVLFLKN